MRLGENVTALATRWAIWTGWYEDYESSGGIMTQAVVTRLDTELNDAVKTLKERFPSTGQYARINDLRSGTRRLEMAVDGNDKTEATRTIGEMIIALAAIADAAGIKLVQAVRTYKGAE